MGSDLEVDNVSETALAVVTMHGIIDLLNSTSLGVYAFAFVAVGLSAPLRRQVLDRHVTWVFFVASWVHFAEDVGFFASALLHFSLACAHLFHSRIASTSLMMAYICGFHIPCLYARLLANLDNPSVLLLTLGIGFAFMCPRPIVDLVYKFDTQRSVFWLSKTNQIVVVFHVLGHELQRLKNE